VVSPAITSFTGVLVEAVKSANRPGYTKGDFLFIQRHS
jgi:hypothetical protein